MVNDEGQDILINLGKIFRESGKNILPGGKTSKGVSVDAVDEAIRQNPWFTQENIRYAMKVWSDTLTEENIRTWQGKYEDLRLKGNPSKLVGLVAAGNIPFVGLHDVLCILLSGHRGLVKLSRDDRVLIPHLFEILSDKYAGLNDTIRFTEGKLSGFDAVIATGSNNTSRYFEYYFGKYPHIIRKNRNGVAVLSGKESRQDLELLAEDIFRYFGLGCRNVSKVYIPSGFDPGVMIPAFGKFQHVSLHSKYMNNYDYQKSILLINNLEHLDNGFILLKENHSIGSPIAVLHIERYEDIKLVKKDIAMGRENIQCVVSDILEEGIPYGRTQEPALWDYADDIDVMEFLLDQ